MRVLRPPEIHTARYAAKLCRQTLPRLTSAGSRDVTGAGCSVSEQIPRHQARLLLQLVCTGAHLIGRPPATQGAQLINQRSMAQRIAQSMWFRHCQNQSEEEDRTSARKAASRRPSFRVTAGSCCRASTVRKVCPRWWAPLASGASTAVLP